MRATNINVHAWRITVGSQETTILISLIMKANGMYNFSQIGVWPNLSDPQALNPLLWSHQ